MTGFTRFLLKELRELASTWRLWVLGGAMLFFALTSPAIAQFTPALVESLTGSQPGLVIDIPDPTYRDALAQWLKNLTQMVSIIVVVVAAGSVASEVASGTAALVLTKPVSRAAFVWAKFVAQVLVLAVFTVAGTTVLDLMTRAVFGSSEGGATWGATGLWFVSAVVMSAAVTALSCRLSALASAGAGVGVYFLMSALTLWGPAVRYSPAGLMSAANTVSAGGDASVAWPLATAAVFTVVIVTVGAGVFSAREI